MTKTPPKERYSGITLQILGVFRLILAIILSAIYLINRKLWPLDPDLSATFQLFLLGYLAFLLFSTLLLKRPRFQNRLTITIFSLIDLTLVFILCFLTDGINSPLIIMILISIMIHGAFLPLWQALVLVFIAIFLQALLWFDLVYSANTELPSLSILLIDQGLIRLIGQGVFAIFAVILSNMWLKKFETSEQLVEAQNRALKNASILHEAIIQQSQAGLIVLDHSVNIILTNKHIKLWFGENIEINMPLLRYIPELAERFYLWHHLQFLDKRPFVAKGEEFYVEFANITHPTLRYSLINIERAETINQRAQQNKLAALGQLTAAIAHEIRNPMTSIHQAAQLLKEQEGNSATENKLVDMITSNVHRANRIINDVLVFAKRERPKQEYLNIQTWLKTLIQEFKHSFPDYKECIIVELNSDFTRAYFDQNHLRQVIWNLMVNCINHSQKNADMLKIYIVAEIISNNPCLSILDNGIGISEEQQKHMFEPFYTTHKTGTGLGLFLVKEICEVNHAYIDYVKISEKGTGFRIIFAKPL